MPIPAAPIEVVPLFAGERAALLELLDELRSEEWEAPTVCAGWTVRDLVAHVLGDDVGWISSWRDGHRNPTFADGVDITRWEEQIAAIDRQNAEWIRATRRISPPLLTELLRATGLQLADVVATLDPHVLAGPVDWAGPGSAPVWLHLAREYTEFWVHQQQIRDAEGRPGLTGRRWLGPVLEAFALAVPPALDRVAAAPGTSARLVIEGEAGGVWRYVRGRDAWQLVGGLDLPADADVRKDADTAWRLFTKGILPADAARAATLQGDAALTAAILETVAILA